MTEPKGTTVVDMATEERRNSLEQRSREETLENMEEKEADLQADGLYGWLNENLPYADTTDNHFIRELVSNVCNSVLIELAPRTYKIDRQTLEERLHLVKQYVKTDDQMLQALYSLQHLANSLGHPRDVLNTFFWVLYSGDAISDDVYRKWLYSTDPHESLGKTQAVGSVIPFFQEFIEHSDCESDSD